MSGFTIFKYVETKGVPLEILLESIKNDYIVDWIEYIETSINHNWRLSNTLKSLEFSIKEVYGQEKSLIIIEKLKQYLEFKGLL